MRTKDGKAVTQFLIFELSIQNSVTQRKLKTRKKVGRVVAMEEVEDQCMCFATGRSSIRKKQRCVFFPGFVNNYLWKEVDKLKDTNANPLKLNRDLATGSKCHLP